MRSLSEARISLVNEGVEQAAIKHAMQVFGRCCWYGNVECKFTNLATLASMNVANHTAGIASRITAKIRDIHSASAAARRGFMLLFF